MVDGILLTLTKPEAVGNVFNIGNPRGTVTIHTLAEKVRELAKSESEIVFVDKNYVDVELRIPSIEKAAKLLDFRPKVDLNEGLIRTIAWYREQVEQGLGSGEVHEHRPQAQPGKEPAEK
jgi:dTDP-glucose 4,6-dehydratase